MFIFSKVSVMNSFRKVFPIGVALIVGDFLFRNSVDVFFNWLSRFFRFVEQSFSFSCGN